MPAIVRTTFAKSNVRLGDYVRNVWAYVRKTENMISRVASTQRGYRVKRWTKGDSIRLGLRLYGLGSFSHMIIAYVFIH
jgi:hypothetical protein